MRRFPVALLVAGAVWLSSGRAATALPPAAQDSTVLPSQRDLPVDYVIGPDDVLSIVFWREKDLSADVVVRADGKISLPLLNDVVAAGLTPLQLRDALQDAAAQYIQDPIATVVVKEINSRKVFITGMITKPGAYPLTGPMTTLQLIATAGGFQEFAKTKDIRIMRTENGRATVLKFNYQDVLRQKVGAYNYELKPGDTVVVP
ncbi:MAG: polysaccharide biosynthesis/export family protein [Vicinamibacterales bacterium]